MIKSNPYRTENHSDKIIQYRQKLINILEKVRNQNLTFSSSLSDLNKALAWFKIQEPSFEYLYKIAIMDLKNVFLSNTQELLVKKIAEELCGILPLHDFVIVGFIKRGIIKWQIEENKPVIMLDIMNPLDKLQTMSKILMYMSTYACRAIYSPNKKWKAQLKLEVYRLAIEYYEEFNSVQSFIMNNPEIEELYLDTSKMI